MRRPAKRAASDAVGVIASALFAFCQAGCTQSRAPREDAGVSGTDAGLSPDAEPSDAAADVDSAPTRFEDASSGIDRDAGAPLGTCGDPIPLGPQLPIEITAVAIYRLVVEQSGLYVFDLETEDGTYVKVDVTKPTSCPEWAHARYPGYVELDAGQPVLLGVFGEGYAGPDFRLTLVHVPPPPSCAAPGTLGPSLPAWVEGHINLGRDDVELSCASTPAIEAVYSFTAPATDSYVFDALASEFKVDLAVVDGDGCGGRQLGCGSPRQRVDLVAGQTVTVVLQLSGAIFDIAFFQGRYQLGVGVERQSCRSPVDYADLAPDSTTQFAWNDYDLPSIGRDREVAVRFTAERDGYYCFSSEQTHVYWDDLEGSVDSDHTALVVLDGDSCAAPLLAETTERCRTHIEEAYCEPLAVAQLSAGQEVLTVLHASSAARPFTLQIEECPDDPCHRPPLRTPGSVTIAPGDWTDVLGVCTATGLSDAQPLRCAGINVSEPAALLEFIAPGDAIYSFDTLATSADTVIGLRSVWRRDLDDSCNDDIDDATVQSRVSERLSKGEQVFLLIETRLESPSELQVNIQREPDATPGG